MDMRKEGSEMEVKKFHQDCYWIPITPVKHSLPIPQPIYTDKQENQSSQANWPESERFFQGNQINQVNLSELDRFRDGFLPESAYSTSSVEPNRPFADFSALADAATVYRTSANISQYVPNWFWCSSVNSTPSDDQHASIRTNLHSISSRGPDIPQCGSSIPGRLTYDLNLPPTTTNAGSSSITTPQFAPVTPDQAKSVQNKQVFDIQNTSIHERANQEKDVDTTKVEVRKLRREKQQAELLEESSCAVLSTPLQENHNPDKRRNLDIDLNKTPQQKPRRKKHRPKVVIEGQLKRIPKPAITKATGRRKYVRRNGLNKSASTPSTGVTSGTTDSNSDGNRGNYCKRSLNFESESQVIDKGSLPIYPSKFVSESQAENFCTRDPYVLRNRLNKSKFTPPAWVPNGTANPDIVGNKKKCCKRSLNFDSESQVTDNSSLPMNPPDFNSESQAQNFGTKVSSKSIVQLCQGMEMVVAKTQLGIAYDLVQSTNQVLKDYISMPERKAQSPSSHIKIFQPHEKLEDDSTNKCTRGKCLIAFSNETDDTQEGFGGVTNTDSQSVPRGHKRAHTSIIDEAQLTNVTVKGPHYNALQAYHMFPVNQSNNQFLGMHIPTVCKKRRTERRRNSVRFDTSWTMTTVENRVRRATMCPLNNDRVNCFACILALSHTGKLTKKRSKGRGRVRDLASLIRIVKSKQQPTFSARGAPKSGNRQGFEVSDQQHTCMEALLADIRPTMATKKRTRRKYLVYPVPHNRDYGQQSFAGSKGIVIWKNMSPIDAIVEQLKQLDINGASKKVVLQQQNALVPYNLRYREQKTLVLYQRDGTVVPFEGPFDAVKKRRPRAKVDLDEETHRVWKLLLENINSIGIDGTDEEKAKWWEDEREVFRGRADSFIARMHLIQGDRRFSQWKGSVVDSVIGVFLTQNVSDHLSSSAFMSLVARFPLKSKSNHGPCSEERIGILVNEPDVCMPDPEDNIKWNEVKSSRPACDQSSDSLHDGSYDEEREVLNSNKSSGSGTGGKSTNNSASKSFGNSENGIEPYHESAVNSSNTQTIEIVASFTRDEREIDDILSSQNSVLSSQNSVDSSTFPTTEGIRSCLRSKFGGSASFMELLSMAGTTKINGVYNHASGNVSPYKKDGKNLAKSMGCDSHEKKDDIPSSYNHYPNPDSGECQLEYINMLEEESTSSDVTKKNEENPMREQSELMAESRSQPTDILPSAPTSSQNNGPCNKMQGQANNFFQSQSMPSKQPNIESETHEHNCQMQKVLGIQNFSAETLDVTESTSFAENPRNSGRKRVKLNIVDYGYYTDDTDNGIDASTSKGKRGRMRKKKKSRVDWDRLRKQAQANGKKRERTTNTMDSVDWEAVRCADVNDIANTIRGRGMNNMLAQRVKDFLNRLVKEHGSTDLEWLRDVPPDKAKEYLLSVRGLGLKSVECVRLLTLHHLAFPVDTNVGRIAVRLGWVPLQPLPESLQLHLLEMYPVLESIQKYLWPRLCKLDQRTLYELHYQMITFGKVFCTKSKPNCNACPMRGECRHFASAFASSRLALPGPDEKSIVCATAENKAFNQNPMGITSQLQLDLPNHNHQGEARCEIKNSEPIVEVPASTEPIIEEPVTPVPEQSQILESDIEDTLHEDSEEIPTIELNVKEFTRNLQNYMQQNMELEKGDLSKAVVALTPHAASIPMPKLKNVSRLRTEHQVYELPDSHPLLEGLDKREPDDPCSYLLAIWTPGETSNSIQPPERSCNSQGFGKLCDKNTCVSCNGIREANSQTVRGTLLIPCRTAMRGSFPLNGTYFQVNEVFADHRSSIIPIDVPRTWIWNLPRRTVYFGTSIPTIFKGLSTEGIQYCFWRGFVCVRGFDQKTRAPRPLMARLHFPVSKLTRTTGKTDDK